MSVRILQGIILETVERHVKGAGVDTQLISANAGDIVIKEAASAVGSNYFDAVSQKSGEKVTGAGPDTQMIAFVPVKLSSIKKRLMQLVLTTSWV